jgi:hypothetical protein
MLLQSQRAEDLVHHADGTAELPSGFREDDPIIHVAEVTDAGKLGHGLIEGGKVDCSHEGREWTAHGNTFFLLRIVTITGHQAATVVADQGDERRVDTQVPENPEE